MFDHETVSRFADNPNSAARELYVEEYIDRRIEILERKIKALHILKGGMSQNFLRSGASNISALLEP